MNWSAADACLSVKHEAIYTIEHSRLDVCSLLPRSDVFLCHTFQYLTFDDQRSSHDVTLLNEKSLQTEQLVSSESG